MGYVIVLATVVGLCGWVPRLALPDAADGRPAPWPGLAFFLVAVALSGLLTAAAFPPPAAADGPAVRITEQPAVSQPGPFSNRGKTVVVPRTQIDVGGGGGAMPAVREHSEITGKVGTVIDGGTLVVGSRLVRLYGVVAPVETQTCTAAGKPWPCGRDAAFALAYETAEHWLRCEERDRDAAGALVAVCFVGPYDLNAIMVRRGWALADRSSSPTYVEDEAAARNAHAGVWRGGVNPPWP